MNAELAELWRFAPAIAVLVIVLWAGHRGYWHWGPGVKIVIEELRRERDEWKELALALLAHYGIDVKQEDKK